MRRVGNVLVTGAVKYDNMPGLRGRNRDIFRLPVLVPRLPDES
jgi:hypothetical protein